MANLFIKHTSASLSINENCDPDVRYVERHCYLYVAGGDCAEHSLIFLYFCCRTDMEGAFNRIVPESWNK